MTKLLEKVRVLENSEIASGYYKLPLRTEFPWKKIKPGQFGMLKCASGLDPFLRRPFSLWQRGANKISILYKIVGKGTKLLSQLRKGDETDLLGPLGNGFKIEKNFSKFLLVAGGSGAFSLIALIEELLKLNKEVYLLFGEKTKNLINFLENLWKEKIEVFFTTEDGSYGKKGKVSELLERKIIYKKRDLIKFTVVDQ